MKNRVATRTAHLALALLAPALAWGQAPPTPAAPARAHYQTRKFVLHGTLGSKAPAKAYLSYAPEKIYRHFSTVVKDGTFTFHGHMSGIFGARAVRVFVLKPGQRLQPDRFQPSARFYLEPGTIRLASPDSVANAVVSGTPLNDDLAALNAATRATSERWLALGRAYDAATPTDRQNSGFQARFKQQSDAIDTEQWPLVKQFILAHPASQVSADALREWADYSPDVAEIEPLFERLTPAVQRYLTGRHDAVGARAVGELAPDFTQPDATGKPVALHDFRGKYVLVSFSPAWCSPCRDENLNVAANYERFKGRNFAVLDVSLERDAWHYATWREAVVTNHLDWTHVSNANFWESKAAQLYRVERIPRNLLIGPDGRIVARNLRGEELTKKLTALLN